MTQPPQNNYGPGYYPAPSQAGGFPPIPQPPSSPQAAQQQPGFPPAYSPTFPQPPIPGQPQPWPPQPQQQFGQFGPPPQYPGFPPAQPSSTPPKKTTNVILIVVAAVVVVALAVAVTLWLTRSDNQTTPPPSSTPIASSAAQPKASQPVTGGDPGIVPVNKSFTDDGTGVTVKVISAGTNWIPALPMGNDSDQFDVRMIGIQLDVSPSSTPDDDIIPNLTLTVPGSTLPLACLNIAELATSDNAKAIAQAISGDSNAEPYHNGSGWMMCSLPSWIDVNDVKDGEGYTLDYYRFLMAGSTPGTWIDSFSYSIDIKP